MNRNRLGRTRKQAPSRARGDDLARPAMKSGLVAGGNSEHFGDDGRRNGKGVLANEVQRSSGSHPEQPLVGEPFHTPRHLFDSTRGESLVNESPKSSVVRRIDVQHVAFESFERAEKPRKPGDAGALRKLPLVLEEPLVLERAIHVVVAREEPPRLSVGKLCGVYRSPRAKLRVEGIGFGLELGAGDVGSVQQWATISRNGPG